MISLALDSNLMFPTVKTSGVNQPSSRVAINGLDIDQSKTAMFLPLPIPNETSGSPPSKISMFDYNSRVAIGDKTRKAVSKTYRDAANLSGKAVDGIRDMHLGDKAKSVASSAASGIRDMHLGDKAKSVGSKVKETVSNVGSKVKGMASDLKKSLTLDKTNDSNSKTAGPLSALASGTQRTQNIRSNAAQAAGISPHLANLGLRNGAVIGGLAGSVLGAMNPGREDGEENSMIGGALRGGLKGMVGGAAIGGATKRFYTNPAIAPHMDAATKEVNYEKNTRSIPDTKAVDSKGNMIGQRTWGGLGSSTQTHDPNTGAVNGTLTPGQLAAQKITVKNKADADAQFQAKKERLDLRSNAADLYKNNLAQSSLVGKGHLIQSASGQVLTHHGTNSKGDMIVSDPASVVNGGNKFPISGKNIAGHGFTPADMKFFVQHVKDQAQQSQQEQKGGSLSLFGVQTNFDRRYPVKQSNVQMVEVRREEVPVVVETKEEFKRSSAGVIIPVLSLRS